MPRDGSGFYTAPPGTDGIPDTTIDSTRYNLFVADVEKTFNEPFPIISGGTGGDTADEALDNLHAEKKNQVVTNFDSYPFMAGSFYAAKGATSAPLSTTAFAGICYLSTDGLSVTVEARSQPATGTTTGPIYIRQKIAGVWSGWYTETAGGGGAQGPVGPQGPAGATGPAGGDGPAGPTGATGAQGPQGVKGDKGDVGATGPQGSTGATGAQGPKGDKGDTGSQGPQGIAGTATVIASDTPPVGANDNTLWYETDTGLLFCRYNDGTSTQWVIACPQPDLNAFLMKTGGTMTGTLTLASNPSGSLDAAPKQYVDTNITATRSYADAGDAAVRSYVDASGIAIDPGNNILLNAGMEVSQQLGTTATNTTPYGSWVYMLDQWLMYTAGTGTFATQQMALTNTPTPGFRNALRMYCGTAYTMAGANDLIALAQWIEGTRFAKLGFGTSGAQPVTISFWVFATATGTMSVGLRNGAANRSYIVPVAVTPAATWQYKSVTIPGDTAGTWPTDNTQGANVVFTLGAGSTFVTPTANAWLAGNFYAQTGSTNFYATAANEVWITGVTMMPGSLGSTAAQSPLMVRPYADELQSCMRYYQKWPIALANGYNVAGGTVYAYWPVSPPMCKAPTSAFSTITYANSSAVTHNSSAVNSYRLHYTTTAAGSSYVVCDIALNARL